MLRGWRRHSNLYVSQTWLKFGEKTRLKVLRLTSKQQKNAPCCVQLNPSWPIMNRGDGRGKGREDKAFCYDHNSFRQNVWINIIGHEYPFKQTIKSGDCCYPCLHNRPIQLSFLNPSYPKHTTEKKCIPLFQILLHYIRRFVLDLSPTPS